LYQTRYIVKTQDHEYVDLEVVKLLSRVSAFCEEETCNYALSFCAFSHKSKYCQACGVTKCGKNINGSITRTGIRNFCSPKQIGRHGVRKLIGTIKSTNSSIHSIHEQKTRGVFTSTFCTIEDTNG
jgi:hypothetical protein